MDIKKGRITVGILVGAITLSWFFLMIYRTEKEAEMVGKEYPYITKSSGLSNIIINKKTGNFEYMKHPSSDLYATLDDGRKVHIWAGYYKDTEILIDDVAFPGDSLVKRIGSDTIYLYKKDSDIDKFNYFFINSKKN